ncbi:MAG TPA: alpha/beta fold hydrolase [Caulobacteraceae bacterium]|jgi:alpha-beta hydrolase superfamily lysophospholipase|nr:alpha/beta fold hydrolase [Caulobacteraceae bacterium]
MKARAFVAVIAAAMSLCACAPTLQQAARPGAAFAGPRLDPQDFVSFDGARLGLTRWDAHGEPWAVIVGVHGMDDYANAFHLAAPYWASRGVTTLAYDQRGFGRSPGRGLWAPDSILTEDLRTIVGLAHARWPHALIAVAGESLGGAVAIEAFASDRPPPADRLVLLAPAVWGWTEQPLDYRAALWAADRFAPGKVFNPPDWLVRKVRPTDNRTELRAMSEDPLMTSGARSDALAGLVTTMQRGQDEIGEVRVPLLYLHGENDAIIPRSAAYHAVARLPPSARTADYAQGYHLLTRDLDGPIVWRDVLAFLRDPGAPLPSGAPPIPRASPHPRPHR